MWYNNLSILFYLEITRSPVSQTAPLNTVVELVCEGHGDYMNFLLENRNIIKADEQLGVISVKNFSNETYLQLVLTVRALVINNGITFGCQVFSFSPFDDVISPTAKLTVKG